MEEKPGQTKRWFSKIEVWLMLGVIVYLVVRLLAQDPQSGVPT